MPGGSVPAEVAEFLDACIDSIPQLETLLLLFEHRGRAWTAHEIASRIYQQPEGVLHLLQKLQAMQLAVPVSEGGDAYRFAAEQQMESRVAQLSAAYRTDLIAVTRHVHTRASRSVLEFARAFDLKKDR